MISYINGEFVNEDEAKISVFDQGGPLQSGIKLQSRLTPKENQLDGGLATFALTDACPVQVGRKPIRTRRPSRSYPKQTKNHLVSRSSRRSPCPPQPSHRIC